MPPLHVSPAWGPTHMSPLSLLGIIPLESCGSFHHKCVGAVYTALAVGIFKDCLLLFDVPCQWVSLWSTGDPACLSDELEPAAHEA